MNNKYSLDNKYEIIGLCDLDKFNEKINEFDDVSWSQIIVQNKLTIDNNKASIKNISKVYLDAKITSNKIVASPSASSPNIEGLKLTEKLLIVSGELFENIIYTSDKASNTMHSIKFTSYFNTYIVVDETIDLENGSYKIYTCIEDANLRLLNSRTINQNIILFLFANRLTPFFYINNEFVFYNHTGEPEKGNEIVRVSFDGLKKALKATSTGKTFTPSRETSYIEFELKDSMSTTTKAVGRVRKDEDGADFANSLNNRKLEIGDLIVITFSNQDNTVLTNYPFDGNIFNMAFTLTHNFKITKDGIVPNIVPNVIILKSQRNNPLVTISFDITDRFLISTSLSNERTNLAYKGQKYFEFILKDQTGGQRLKLSIEGDQPGIVLSNIVPFDFGYTIELFYEEGEKVDITDNPYPSSTKTTLSGRGTKEYLITRTGLQEI